MFLFIFALEKKSNSQLRVELLKLKKKKNKYRTYKNHQSIDIFLHTMLQFFILRRHTSRTTQIVRKTTLTHINDSSALIKTPSIRTASIVVVRFRTVRMR